MLSHNVFRIAPDGKIAQVIGPDGDGAGHELREPRSLAVDAKGNLYVAGDRRAPTSSRSLPRDASARSSTRAGTGAATALSRPIALAVDGQGNLFVVGSGSQNVLKRTPDGQADAG